MAAAARALGDTWKEPAWPWRLPWTLSGPSVAHIATYTLAEGFELRLADFTRNLIAWPIRPQAVCDFAEGKMTT